MNGKGDARRPTLVDEATLAGNWERTFGRKVPVHPPTQVGTLDPDRDFTPVHPRPRLVRDPS